MAGSGVTSGWTAAPLAWALVGATLLGYPISAQAQQPGVSSGPGGERSGEQDSDAAVLDAGVGRGVTIRSADGAFSLRVRARGQFRFTHAQQLPGLDASNEFLMRRARLVLQGDLLGPLVGYNIQLAFANLDMESDLRSPLRDANIIWRPLRDLQLRAGQMKVPFDRQRVTSSSALQFVDRSAVTSELNLDRDVGVVLFSDDLFGCGGVFQYQLGLMHGEGRNRLSGDSGLLYVARIQLNPFGEFEDHSEADFERTKKVRLSIGLGTAYNQRSPRMRSTFDGTFRFGRVDYFHAEADLSFKWQGWSIIAQGLYRRASKGVLKEDSNEAEAPLEEELTRSAVGWFVQSGYLFSVPIELAARYGQLEPVGTSAVESLREVGGAISWYFDRHFLKVQADYFHYIGGGLAPPIGRHQARLQAQFFF